MTNSDIVWDESPMPPRDGESARYAGTQLLCAQYPKSEQAFINVRNTVATTTCGANSKATRPRLADVSRQIAGSSTPVRIHNVTSAGAIPTKKTPRHPHRGSTINVVSAARP